MNNLASFQALRSAYPWPGTRPDVKSVDWAIDAGGKQLITKVIQKKELSLVLEIGVFLGGSAKVWLNASPNVVLLAVDRWSGRWEADYAREMGKEPWIIEQLAHENGSYHTFLANLWDYRSRVIPIRADSRDAIHAIAQRGLQPDLVYLDADKSGREIEICHRLFPQAVISGDDWWWGEDRWWNPDHGYPIREPVKRFCRHHQLYLKTAKHTWLADDEPPSLMYRLQRPGYHLKSLRRRARVLVHRLLRPRAA